ncbi:hypothetical protein ABK040_005293 [Willaertia magna]
MKRKEMAKDDLSSTFGSVNHNNNNNAITSNNQQQSSILPSTFKIPKKKKIEKSEEGSITNSNNTCTSIIPTTTTINNNKIKEQQLNKQEENKELTSEMLNELLETLENSESFEFSDTHTAFLKIRQEIKTCLLVNKHKMFYIFPPIILKRILYNEKIIKNLNRTEVDQTIDEMILKKEILQFVIFNSIFGYVFIKDYIEIIWNNFNKLINIKNTKKTLQKNNFTVEEKREFLNLFINNVLYNFHEPFIDKELLTNLLKRQVTDKEITLLIELGIFTIRDESSYHFTIPNIGIFLNDLKNGQNEILSILRRKQFKEMNLDQLYKIRLKNSIFSTKFHIREMICNGSLILMEVGNVQLVRIK